MTIQTSGPGTPAAVITIGDVNHDGADDFARIFCGGVVHIVAGGQGDTINTPVDPQQEAPVGPYLYSGTIESAGNPILRAALNEAGYYTNSDAPSCAPETPENPTVRPQDSRSAPHKGFDGDQ